MSYTVDLHKRAMKTLIATSRTFSIPIRHLPKGLKEAVTSAYLCMRAIDEIEDHDKLPNENKLYLLRSISSILQQPSCEANLETLFHPYNSLLPEVTIRVGQWAKLIPPSIAPHILLITSKMSERMAGWVCKEWRIKDEKDLDHYTFDVAGLVGRLLSDLWEWYEAIETDRDLAVAFGRGLQAVNIIRNRTEDLKRGVDFFPDGWEIEDMIIYAQRNLALADAYIADIKHRPIVQFCEIPLILAHRTLDAVEAGEKKLTKAAVSELVSQIYRRSARK